MKKDKPTNHLKEFLNKIPYLLKKIYKFSSTHYFHVMVVVSGLILRLKPYLTNRNLTNDEAVIATAFIDAPPRIMTQPKGFLTLIHMTTDLLGYDERIFRLIPFIAGFLAIIAFYALLKRFFRNGHLISFALILFAFLPPLIAFSWDTKQYSTDVLLSMLLFIYSSYFLFDKKTRVIHLAVFVIMFSAFLMVSEVIIFTAAGILGAIALTAFKQMSRYRTQLLYVVMTGGIVIIIFGAYYFLQIDGLDDHAALQEYWNTRFLPIPFVEKDSIERLTNLLVSMFKYPIGLYVPSFALILAIIPLFDKKLNSLTWYSTYLILLVVAGASILRKMPVDRTLLFITPYILILITKGLHILVTSLNSYGLRSQKILIGVLCTLILLPPVAVSVDNLFSKPRNDDIRSAAEFVKGKYQTGDVIYVSYPGYRSFNFYSLLFDLSTDTIIRGTKFADYDMTDYTENLSQLFGSERIWVVASNLDQERGREELQFIRATLDERGTIIKRERTRNIKIFLYDLREEADAQ